MVASTFFNFGTRVVVVLAVAGFAAAHFTLNMPAPSREKQAYTDTEMYFPIGGSKDLRSKLDCLQLPRGKVASLRAGSTTQFTFEIDETADHEGMCTAQLLDAKTGSLVADLGKQSNCVSGPRAMAITLPNKNCASCVVKIKVTATHISKTNPEYYDSCVDVNISGGTDAAIIVTSASKNSSHPVLAAPATSLETSGAQDAFAAKNTLQMNTTSTSRNKRPMRQILGLAWRNIEKTRNQQGATQTQNKKCEKPLARRSRDERRNRAHASANRPFTSDSFGTSAYLNSSAVGNNVAGGASAAYTSSPDNRTVADDSEITDNSEEADSTDSVDDSGAAYENSSTAKTDSAEETGAADSSSGDDNSTPDDSEAVDDSEYANSIGSGEGSAASDDNSSTITTDSAAYATASVDDNSNATDIIANDAVFYSDPMLQGA